MSAIPIKVLIRNILFLCFLVVFLSLDCVWIYRLDISTRQLSEINIKESIKDACFQEAVVNAMSVLSEDEFNRYFFSVVAESDNSVYEDNSFREQFTEKVGELFPEPDREHFDTLDKFLRRKGQKLALPLYYYLELVDGRSGEPETLFRSEHNLSHVDQKKATTFIYYYNQGHTIWYKLTTDISHLVWFQIRPMVWFSFLISLLLLLVIFFLYYSYKKMQEFHYSKDDFINIMAHNMKNPIAVISASNDLLLHQPCIDDKPLAKKLLIINQGHIKNLNKNIELVLSRVRKPSKAIQEKISTVSILEVSEHLVEEFSMRCPEARFSLNIAPAHTIKVDPDDIRDILDNLIDNAVKYSEGTPEVKVSTDLTADGYLDISVEDHGIGIPKKERKKIFSQHYRVSRENNRLTDGFGLGLYFVKMKADIYGWKLQVTETEGGGSTFTIRVKQ